MHVSDNHSDNETFGKVRDRNPISGISVESKSVRFDRKDLFTDVTNSGNRSTDALPRECAETIDKIRLQDQDN